MTTSAIKSPGASRIKTSWVSYIITLQDEICRALENADGQQTFREDNWEREEGKGGGGRTRVLAGGAVFEKAGVNTSAVFGSVTEKMKQQLPVGTATDWFAAGLSLVIHPFSPFVPTIHANWRYFELYDPDGQVTDCWFGGGIDLTPYYLFEEDASGFHNGLKHTLDRFGPERYPLYKKQCDAYFANAHRNHEMRGIGGIFYDHLRPADESEASLLYQFQVANGNAFLSLYLPIVTRRKKMAFSKEQKYWQEIRRGRYVEFNLLHDRGTIFGLKTDGRTESILMSLPPTVRFDYNYQPVPGSREDKLLQACLHPRDWISPGPDQDELQ